MLISASNLANPQTGEAKCRFGNTAPVAARFVNAAGGGLQLECFSPRVHAGSWMPVEVALNGQQFTANNISFLYYNEVQLSAPTTPTFASMRGGCVATLARVPHVCTCAARD